MERQARRAAEADVIVEGDRAVVAEPGGVVGAQRGGRVRAEVPVVMAVAVHGRAGRPDQAVALLGDPARRGKRLVPGVQADLVARLRELVEDPPEARLRDVVGHVVGGAPAVMERRRGEEPGRREAAARLALHEPVEDPEVPRVRAAQQRARSSVARPRASAGRAGAAGARERAPAGRVAVRMVHIVRQPDREARAVRPAVRPAIRGGGAATSPCARRYGRPAGRRHRSGPPCWRRSGPGRARRGRPARSRRPRRPAAARR